MCNSCNMGTGGLPDMYTRGPRAEGVHIRQTTSAHVTTDMCHAINHGKHKFLTPHTIPSLTYIYMDTLNGFDCGILLCHYLYVIHTQISLVYQNCCKSRKP